MNLNEATLTARDVEQAFDTVDRQARRMADNTGRDLGECYRDALRLTRQRVRQTAARRAGGVRR